MIITIELIIHCYYLLLHLLNSGVIIPPESASLLTNPLLYAKAKLTGGEKNSRPEDK